MGDENTGRDLRSTVKHKEDEKYRHCRRGKTEKLEHEDRSREDTDNNCCKEERGTGSKEREGRPIPGGSKAEEKLGGRAEAMQRR